MIGREEFDHFVREALFNLFDVAALENSPLNDIFPKPANYTGSRADFLHKHITKTIESLRPEETPAVHDPTWRPYFILSERYIERVDIPELCNRLSLSERQIRREHARSLKALSTRLWDMAVPSLPKLEDGAQQKSPVENNDHEFAIHLEPLNISEVLDGVIQTFNHRAGAETSRIVVDSQPDLPKVLADRILLRQIFFRLLRYSMDIQASGVCKIYSEQNGETVSLRFESNAQHAAQYDEEESGGEAADLIELIYWLKRIDARFEEIKTQHGRATLVLTLPLARMPVVLVVDDQETAIRMYQRYLSQSRVKVIGISQPEEVLKMARQAHPDIILLDVMMPTIDGWEVLLSLKTAEDTRGIPVIVCSVWDEPSMAHSLGAVGFLKKPISQKDLLYVLAELNVLDSPEQRHQSNI